MSLEPAKARARKAFRLALNELGRRIVADIRDSISTRVQHIGGEIIRSEPGEPPYREYSDLWKSIKYKVNAGASNLDDLTVFTARIQAFYLEYGTINMEPRPFWAPARRRAKGLTAILKQLTAEKLRELKRR